MPGTVPGSPVLEFYNDAKIFITGGTGFLGKALLEKFIRVCPNVDHIYVLIRQKKEKDSMTRMKELLEDPLFNTLRKEKPDFEKKVTCIPGDVGSVRLGMGDNDFEFLTNEVTHVFHSAATVRFNEKLKTAININVMGTHEILKFCNKCVRLKVFVHVSTAYAYCVRKTIGEDYYEPPLLTEKVLGLVDTLSEEKLNSVTQELIKPWPNTYTYTKAIAENVVRENGKSIPAVIFRPSIVMGTYKEPVPGWIDNIYGPTGVIVAVGAGVMRVLYADESVVANIIPVDLTVNAIISCAWEAGSNFNNNTILENSLDSTTECSEIDNKTEKVPKIYNFVVDNKNSITWREFLKLNLKYGKQVPIKKSVWYYTLTLTKTKIVYLSLIFLFHYIPAILADTVLFLLRKEPQMLKTYQKIHTFSEVMSVFSLNNWKFKDNNMKKLWSRLSDADKELFDFDMTKVNWQSYLSNVIIGIRSYIFNETEKTLPAAKRKMFFFWLGHRLIQFCFLGCCFWILSKLICPYDDLKTHFKDLIEKPSELIRNST